jgi:hypothetical protein
MDIAARVRLPLLLLRIGVFIVMLMWTLDKFARPGRRGSLAGSAARAIRARPRAFLRMSRTD